MKVGIIQSSYVPWRGYFDLMASVDAFVFYDDVQYTKGDWRNRNRIKTFRGIEWLTVPVHYKKLKKKISETTIDYKQQWDKKHFLKLRESYQDARYSDEMLELASVIQSSHFETISELNIKLIELLCSYLDISTPTYFSSDFALYGTKTDRLINLLKKLNATAYLSGSSADSYLDKDAFRSAGIQLEYKSYDYEPYPQLWGGFNGAVSVLDLIANCGTKARGYLTSRTQDQIVIPGPNHK
jgi:hypothetical protein